MNCLLKSLGQIQCDKVGYPSVCLVVFSIRTWGRFSTSPYTFCVSQSHFLHLSLKSFEQQTEMTFARKLANITGPVGRG